MKKISLLLALVATMFSCSLTSTEEVTGTLYEQYDEKWVVLDKGVFREEPRSFNPSTAVVQSNNKVLFSFSPNEEPSETVANLRVNGDTTQNKGGSTYHAAVIKNGKLIYSLTVESNYFKTPFIRKYYKIKQ